MTRVSTPFDGCSPVRSRHHAMSARNLTSGIAMLITLILPSCSPATSQPTPSLGTGSPPGASPSIASLSWNYAAFGDSWPEDAHCNGCRTFAGLWADDLPALAGRPIVFTDLTGSPSPVWAMRETSATLLESLRTNETTSGGSIGGHHSDRHWPE